MYNKWEKETLSYKQENIFRNLYCLWNLSALFLHIFLSWKPFFLSDIDTDIETQIEIKYYTVEGRHDFQPCVSDGKFPWHSRSFKNYRFEDNKIEITPSWDSYTCIWQKHFINEKRRFRFFHRTEIVLINFHLVWKKCNQISFLLHILC